jgi:chromosome segregation ATPase
MIHLARSARTFIVLTLVATVGYVTLQGQREPAESGDMKALVAEVRALRLAIERAAASTSQSQLLLGRVQLQENRLATLSRQYQEARTRSLDAQMAQADLESQLRQTTQRLDSPTLTAPDDRRALEGRVGDLKSEVARQQARTTQLRGDETMAGEMLASEQQRWSDFNQRLETIERTLGKDLPPHE